MSHVAKWATPRANVTQDHEGGRAATKAFAYVGATGLFADRVQLVVAQDFFDFLVALAVGHFHAYPVRFTLHRLRDNLNWNARGLGRIPFFYAGDFCFRQCRFSHVLFHAPIA